MAKIVNERQVKKSIEVGDILVVSDHYFRFIGIDNRFGLLDVESGEVHKLVDHVTHAINWIKKYHGEFAVIDNDDIEVTFR